jgi:hypothetical protein
LTVEIAAANDQHIRLLAMFFYEFVYVIEVPHDEFFLADLLEIDNYYFTKYFT